MQADVGLAVEGFQLAGVTGPAWRLAHHAGGGQAASGQQLQDTGADGVGLGEVVGAECQSFCHGV